MGYRIAGLGGMAALAALPLFYLWNPALVLVVLFQALSWLGETAGAPGDCSGRWSAPVDASVPYLGPFFPETQATYRVLTLDTEANGRPLAFAATLTGPAARYSSLHLYDARSGLPLAALSDRQMGLTPGVERTVRIGPGEAFAWPAGTRRVALVWRVYLGAQSNPPRVAAADAGSGAVVACPSGFALPASVSEPASAEARAAAFAALAADQRARLAAGDAAPIRFAVRRAADTALFANVHVVYAWAPLDPALGESAEVRFRPPPLARAASQPGVRYWSVCLGGARETSTSACLADEAVAVGPDGVARIVVGPGNRQPEDQAGDAAAGINRLGWGWFSGKRVLILRQLDDGKPFAGGFGQSLDAVPAGADPAKALGDFGPSGRYGG